MSELLPMALPADTQKQREAGSWRFPDGSTSYFVNGPARERAEDLTRYDSRYANPEIHLNDLDRRVYAAGGAILTLGTMVMVVLTCALFL